MTRSFKALTATASIALATAMAAPALAAGTAANTTITNSAAVSYQVNAISQSDIASSASVTVDRVIRMTLAEVDTATTTVTPGQTRAVLAFQLTNTSNATLDFVPSVVQPAGGAAAHGGTDTFNVTNGSFFADTNTSGSYESGTDLPLTFLDEVLADTSRTFFYVADVPLGQPNGAVAGVTVTTTAHESATPGNQGTAVVATVGANTAAMDTVFADGAGATDAARDGAFSAQDDFTVSTATLTVTRTNTVISNSTEGTSNPKAIPTAIVEHCVIVSNAAGAPSASNLVVADTFPSIVSFVGLSLYVGGSVTGGVCNADGTLVGSATPTDGQVAGTKVITGTIGTLAGGETKTIRYRLQVN